MSVSSVNGYSSVQQQEQVRDVDYQKALEITSRMNDEFVSKDDIKTPGQVVASVGFASAKTFFNGAVAYSAVDKIFKGGVSNVINSAGKKGLNFINNAVTNLEKGASSKVKDFAIKCLKQVKTKVPKIAARVKLPVLAGILAIGAMVPSICSRDNNDDGIKDIAQKSQSAYDNFEKKSQNLISGASDFASLMQILS